MLFCISKKQESNVPESFRTRVCGILSYSNMACNILWQAQRSRCLNFGFCKDTTVLSKYRVLVLEIISLWCRQRTYWVPKIPTWQQWWWQIWSNARGTRIEVHHMETKHVNDNVSTSKMMKVDKNGDEQWRFCCHLPFLNLCLQKIEKQ